MSVAGQVKSQHTPSFAIYALLSVACYTSVLCNAKQNERRKSYRTRIVRVGCLMGQYITAAFASVKQQRFYNEGVGLC